MKVKTMFNPTGDEVRKYAERKSGGKIPDALWSGFHDVSWRKAYQEEREKAIDDLAVTLTDVMAEEGYSGARIEAMKLLGLWKQPSDSEAGK